MRLEFYAYSAGESGLGAQQHDVEPMEFEIGVARSDGEFLKRDHLKPCDRVHYVILVTRVSGKAHGIEPFWNIVDVDPASIFPVTWLVEEGRHALATASRT